MAILNHHFRQIINSFQHISSQGKKLATLGYPDSLVTEDILQELYKDHKTLPLNDLSDSIRAHHGRGPEFQVYDLIKIFKERHDFDTTVFDISTHRGIETLINLNEPIEDKFKYQFDCVVDSSVLEHCFNVAQAFKNLCQLVKLGGVVSTVNPIYMYNHGYYNINPIMLRDGFVHNGFEVLYSAVIDIHGNVVESFTRKTVPIKVFNLFVAKKIEVKEFIYPIQKKGK